MRKMPGWDAPVVTGRVFQGPTPRQPLAMGPQMPTRAWAEGPAFLPAQNPMTNSFPPSAPTLTQHPPSLLWPQAPETLISCGSQCGVVSLTSGRREGVAQHLHLSQPWRPLP